MKDTRVNIKSLHKKLSKIAKEYYNTTYALVRIECHGYDQRITYSTYIAGSTWYQDCSTFEESLQEHINNSANGRK